MPHAYTFNRTICLCDLNDADVEAEFSADDSGNFWLETVKIGQLALTSEQVRQMIGAAELDRQLGFIREWWLEDGLHDARIDARAAWAEAAE